jgi:hypothetical protein
MTMERNFAGFTCLLYTVFLVPFFAVAALCFDYSFYRLFGKDLPWYVDLVGGLVLNAINIPVAVILWICEHADVLPTPVFGG